MSSAAWELEEKGRGVLKEGGKRHSFAFELQLDL